VWEEEWGRRRGEEREEESARVKTSATTRMNTADSREAPHMSVQESEHGTDHV
jgi:hypothetical protein